MNWKEELLTARKKWYLKNYQGARDFGVPLLTKPYNDTTSNGLTRCIYDWLRFHDHYVNRINTQGQVRVERIQLAHGNYRDNVKWTKGQTNLGTADLDVILNGKPVKIEVKAGKDKLRADQLKEKQRVENAGGIYYVVRNMEHFLSFYKSFFL